MLRLRLTRAPDATPHPRWGLVRITDHRIGRGCYGYGYGLEVHAPRAPAGIRISSYGYGNGREFSRCSTAARLAGPGRRQSNGPYGYGGSSATVRPEGQRPHRDRSGRTRERTARCTRARPGPLTARPYHRAGVPSGGLGRTAWCSREPRYLR